MTKKSIYKISVLNWEKYNSKSKPGHPSIMLSKRFLDDAKIQSLPQGGRLLYLGLLLRRGEVRDTFIEASKQDLVRLAGGSGNVIDRLLGLLQSLQMVTFEKIEPLSELNRIEKNRIEKNEIASTSEKQKKEPPNTLLNKQIWSEYLEAYQHRYKVVPVRNPKVNGQISQLGKRLGHDAIHVIRFFVNHNDQYYLKTTHSIGSCLKDAESLHTQWQRGKAITTADVRRAEKAVSTQQMIKEADEGGF